MSTHPVVKEPTALNALPAEINFIASGGVHSLLITKDEGQVYAMGSNHCGQLGIGPVHDKPLDKPSKVT
jgi:alpha-tubulin suppressor-like RCC1 family protein